VNVPTTVADEVVVVLLLDEAEPALGRAKRELAQDPLGDQHPQGAIDGGQADARLSLPERAVDPVDRGVNGVLLEQPEDGFTIEVGSRHGGLPLAGSCR
jgi:hypothetical protein